MGIKPCTPETAAKLKLLFMQIMLDDDSLIQGSFLPVEIERPKRKRAPNQGPRRPRATTTRFPKRHPKQILDWVIEQKGKHGAMRVSMALSRYWDYQMSPTTIRNIWNNPDSWGSRTLEVKSGS